jgi:hypothetical protein
MNAENKNKKRPAAPASVIDAAVMLKKPEKSGEVWQN